MNSLKFISCDCLVHTLGKHSMTLCLVICLLTAQKGGFCVAHASTREDNNIPSVHGHGLSPRQFRNVPSSIAAQLDSMQCLVPQPQGTKTPTNIVSGQFARKGQTDWAALCLKGRYVPIVFVWGGRHHCTQIPWKGNVNDATALQLRTITFADIQLRRKMDKRFRLPLPIHHDSIEVIFGARGTAVWYCARDSWVQLWSAD